LQRKGEVDASTGAVEVAKAAVANAKLNYEWCSVTAPIEGRASRHYIDIGNNINANASVLTNIVNLRPVWAYFYVDENTANNVQKEILQGKMHGFRQATDPVGIGNVLGMLATPQSEGLLLAAADLYPRLTAVQMALGNAQAGEFPINGLIDFVSNQLDPNTGSIQVRATFANPNEILQAGLFGRIRMPVSGPHNALLVLDSAIGSEQGQNFVLVVNDKNEVESRPVETGLMHDRLREVKRTRTIVKSDPQGRQIEEEVVVLKPTDRIIINGLQRVRPGSRVEPRVVGMDTLLPELPKKKE
jgi:RND family efflux transporter MFP subunit